MMRIPPVWLVLAVAAAGSGPALATAASGGAGIDYPSIWACDRSKFNWYCDLEPETPGPATEPVEPTKAKTREEQALERIETLQKELKAKRALAIVDDIGAIVVIAIVYSDTFEKYRLVITTEPFLLIHGRVQRDGEGTTHLMAMRIEAISIGEALPAAASHDFH